MLLGDGVPANDILGLGVIGRYRLNNGWFIGAGIDTYAFDYERPWRIVGLEQDPDVSTIFAELNFNSLLRGDTEQRFRSYAIARNWGWLSANDVRRLENQNSIGPDGDAYLKPLNMVDAGDPAEPSGMGNPPNRQDGQDRQAHIPKNGAANGKDQNIHRPSEEGV